MKKNHPTVLITGGTGFIGQHLVHKLVTETDYNLVLLVRSQQKFDTVRTPLESKYHPRIKALVADLLKPSTLNLPSSVTHIIHLAALTNAPKDARDVDRLFRRWNVDATRHLLTAAPRTLKQFVFISSVDAAGSLSPVINSNEHQIEHPDTAYDRSKQLAEKTVKKMCAARKTPYTILRPSMVYGPGASNPEAFKINNLIHLYLKLVKRGVFPLLGSGHNHVPLVSVDTVTQACLLALTTPQAQNQTYIITDNPTPTFRELIKTMATVLNPNCLLLPFPLWLLQPTLSIGEAILAPLGKSPPLSPQGLKYLTTSRSYSNKKVQQDLGLKHQPLSSSIQKTVKWYQENNLL